MNSEIEENQSPSTEESAAPERSLEALEAKYKALEEEFLRFRAESENQRKRVLKDADSARKFAAERLLNDLLPVADTLFRGVEVAQSDKASIETLTEGKTATLRMLLKTLENHGVKEVNPAPGEGFNPDVHQAVSMQAVENAEPNTVVAVMQRGFTLHERLLRPAMVVVSAS
jgi:molecular chaperone GrpE